MRRATAISLTEAQRRNLEQLRRGRRVAVRLAERAAIVLLADDGMENQQIAAELGISRHKAGRWRDRYAKLGLPGIEKDAPRPGRHRRIDDEQRAAIVRKTLREKPEGQTHWSRSSMAGIGPCRPTVASIHWPIWNRLAASARLLLDQTPARWRR